MYMRQSSNQFIFDRIFFVKSLSRQRFTTYLQAFFWISSLLTVYYPLDQMTSREENIENLVLSVKSTSVKKKQEGNQPWSGSLFWS